MAEPKEKTIYRSDEIERALTKLSEFILKGVPPEKDLVLIGIAAGGVPLADRLRERLEKKHRPALSGILDITFYRDDIAMRASQPVIKRTEIPFNLDDKYVVLVDDVLYSGRTTRAAMDALVDFGRPEVVRLAVLVDRGHRELPIHADCVGFELKTDKEDQVRVYLEELGDEEDRIVLVRKGT